MEIVLSSKKRYKTGLAYFKEIVSKVALKINNLSIQLDKILIMTTKVSSLYMRIIYQ